MDQQQLQQFIQENPEVVLAIMELIMQMNEEQLQQFVQGLQQLMQQKQSGGEQDMGGGQGYPEGESPEAYASEDEMANEALF